MTDSVLEIKVNNIRKIAITIKKSATAIVNHENLVEET